MRASAGYTLKIPIGTQPQYHTWAGIEPAVREPSEITVYKVRRGDSILRIAQRFGVRSDDIIIENEILPDSASSRTEKPPIVVFNTLYL